MMSNAYKPDAGMAEQSHNRANSNPRNREARPRAVTEPILPALNGEIQPVAIPPVDSLTLLGPIPTAALNNPLNIPPPPPPPNQPRESIRSQLRAQFRQLLGLGQQPLGRANNPQDPTANPRATGTVNQPLVDALNLSLPPNGTDEQTRVLVQRFLEQAQQGIDLQDSQTANLLTTLDVHLRTPLLQALNLSQQEMNQNQARLQAFRTAIEASLQQTTSGTSSVHPVTARSSLANFTSTNFSLPINPLLLGSQLASTREDFIFLADCSFRVNRHDELLEHVRGFLTVLGQHRDLLKDERYFIAVGYKDWVRGLRDAWRKVKKTQTDEKNAFKLGVSNKYRLELEEKMRGVCAEGLLVSDGLLIDTVMSMETRLYFSKVKGDLYRYMMEYSTGNEKIEAASLGRSSYEEADRIKNCVSAVHPIRLGLALNFGVFLRDACQDSNRGWRVTKVALDDANRGFQLLAELDSNDYRESNGLLVNLRRNLMRWNTVEIDADIQNTGHNQMAIRN